MTSRETIRFGRLGLLCALALATGRPANSIAQQTPESNTYAHAHVIHRFDFTEPENLNPMPKHWLRFPDPSLPIYPDREFPRSSLYFRDTKVGHDAAPALYIDPAGRNAALRYRGVETTITPGDYVITGWIRPDRLAHARAAISAYYLDWQKQPIAGTQQFSELVFGDGETSQWTRVRVDLQAAPHDAVAIGITCWVVQQEVWRADHVEPHHINLRDVRGGAWFDDIEVHAQPEMQLRFRWTGNVVTLPDQPEFDILVRDVNPSGLTASVTIEGPSQELLFDAPVDVDSFNNPIRRQRVVADRLEPGLYTAALSVRESGRLVSYRRMRLAVLQDFASEETGSARRLGVMFHSENASALQDKLALMDAIGAESVKFPLWPDDSRQEAHIFADLLPQYLAEFGKRHWSVIGLIATPPPGVRVGREGNTAKLISLLADGSGIIREALTTVIAPYAVMLESWQVGMDSQPVTRQPMAKQAIDRTRAILKQFVSAPFLGTTTSIDQLPRRDIDLENQCVRLDSGIPPEYLVNSLSPFLSSSQAISVFAPPPDYSRGDQEKVLGAWALRIIAALAMDVRSVYTADLWSPTTDDPSPVLQPNRQLIAFRTIARLIGDATPFRRVLLGGGVRGFSFRHQDFATLVLWRRSPDVDLAPVRIQLGRSPRAFDIEGREIRIGFDDHGVALVPVGEQPIIVTGVEQWLVTLLTDTRLNPDKIEFGYAPTNHQLTFTNRTLRPMSGRIHFIVPDDWEIEPASQQFVIQPGEQWATHISLRQAGNETAGLKRVTAEIRLTSAPGYLIPVDSPLRLDAENLDVWAYAIADGNNVMIRQGITNLSRRPVSLQGFAALPGQTRRYRAVNTLKMGGTATFDYRFRTDNDPIGQTVRLGLRRNDGVIVHNLHVTVQ